MGDGVSNRFVIVAALVAGSLLAARGQWLNYPAPGAPRTRAGKPDLAAKAPRADHGKPDLSGVWQPAAAPPGENDRLFGDALRTFAVPEGFPQVLLKHPD
jgi:hypothetical protein